MYGIKDYIEIWKKGKDFSWNSFWLMFGTFLDDFYVKKDVGMLNERPNFDDIPIEFQAFVAASVDYLAHTLNKITPTWAMKKEFELAEPLFPSGLIGDIKAVMLIESPIEYKVRNIYVLRNILSRC